MAQSEYYVSIKHKWFPSLGKPPQKTQTQVKAVKYNHIDLRPPKQELRQEQGNLEVDSVIGKATDKYALQTTIDITTGQVTISKYNRSALGFALAFKDAIKQYKFSIKTVTMDNGSENNLLHTVIEKGNLYNCRAYCSGDKGTIENMHRHIRKIVAKGQSIDSLTTIDIQIIQDFVNNYYSKTFNRL